MSNVVFLPGWTYTPSEEDQERFKELQIDLSLFHAEIEYQHGDLPYPEYYEKKQMAHLRIRQIMGIVRRVTDEKRG